MSNATGTETLRQLGMLGKQRREEVGLNRPALARDSGIESEDTLKAFEYGKALPPEVTWRKLEEALSWRLGIIEEVTRRTARPAPLTMEELDAEDSYYLTARGGVHLALASDDELQAEMARRAKGAEKGPENRQSGT